MRFHDVFVPFSELWQPSNGMRICAGMAERRPIEKNASAKNALKMRQNPQRLVHTVLDRMAGRKTNR
jgi:hypothetical protein